MVNSSCVKEEFRGDSSKDGMSLLSLLHRIGYDAFSCLNTQEGHAGSVPREPADGIAVWSSQYSEAVSRAER